MERFVEGRKRLMKAKEGPRFPRRSVMVAAAAGIATIWGVFHRDKILDALTFHEKIPETPLPFFEVRDPAENPFTKPPEGLDLTQEEFVGIARDFAAKTKIYFERDVVPLFEAEAAKPPAERNPKLPGQISRSFTNFCATKLAQSSLKIAEYMDRRKMHLVQDLADFVNQFALAGNAYVEAHDEKSDNLVSIQTNTVEKFQMATIAIPGTGMAAENIPIAVLPLDDRLRRLDTSGIGGYYQHDLRVIIAKKTDNSDLEERLKYAIANAPLFMKELYRKEGFSDEEFGSTYRKESDKRTVLHEGTHALLSAIFPSISRMQSDNDYKAPVNLVFKFEDAPHYVLHKGLRPIFFQELAAIGAEIASNEKFVFYAAFEKASSSIWQNQLAVEIFARFVAGLKLPPHLHPQQEAIRSFGSGKTEALATILADPAVTREHVQAIGKAMWNAGFEGLRQMEDYVKMRMKK